MSSSVVGRLKSLIENWTARRSGRWAVVAAAAAAPIGILGIAMQNVAFLAVFALALALAVVAGAMVLARLLGERRDGAEAHADAFEQLVEHVRDGVLHFNARGELVRASRTCGVLFGCESYELAGSGLTDRTHILDRPLLMSAMAEAREDGAQRIFEVRMRRDGAMPGQAAPEFIWVEINLSPIVHERRSAGPFATFALLRDICHRKQNERMMREAQRTAEDASEAKSRFLATIGHELRTPLNAIVGFSDMMANGIGGQLSPAHAEYAALIGQSSHHLLDVVNMLLDMSKIEAGRFEIHAERFEPGDLVAPCIRMVSAVARERNVEVAVDLGRNLPEIVGDERACRQILINLLSNAVKFSNPGDCVTWSMKRQGQALAITVADTGIGMDADVVGRLGEPFYQAEDTRVRNYEGTGLGLSIVKGLVDLHDGTLKIRSEPGRGTTIVVLLPVNGPETGTGDNDRITKLKPETHDAKPVQWREAKRIAR